MPSTASSLTRRLVEHVYCRVGQPLPVNVETTARLCILDWIAVTMAGSGEPLSNILRDEALADGSAPLAAIVGRSERCSPRLAALVNAAAADAMDFSDGNLAMHGHTTPAVIAVAFALAESTGASFGDIVDGIVAGIEMECRIGLIVNPPLLRIGFHPTGSLATFGATATASTLLKLAPEQWEFAIGLAATQAAGVLASGGSMAKPFHSGKAAMNGLLAASLAQRGFISNPAALEAANGFLETHSQGDCPTSMFTADGSYLIMGTIFKSHAACQLTHSSIENMLKLRKQHGVDADAIENIELQVPRVYMSVCNISVPTTALEAKFSLRGVTAMTLLGDDTRNIDAYRPERIQRTEMLAMLEKIKVVARDDISGGQSIAIVGTKDGRTISLESDTYKPIEDLSIKEGVVVQKFHTLVRPLIGDLRARELEKLVMNESLGGSVQSILPYLAIREAS